MSLIEIAEAGVREPRTRGLRIALVVNPIAGGGHGSRAAETLAEALAAAGHACIPHETRRGLDRAWLDDALRDSDLAVVVGGDGAVRMVAEPAARAGVPIWQSPLGTENLFAREFGMGRGAATLLAALARGRLARIDLGRAAGEPFLLMASVGYDAEVVHDLAAHRAGAISHLSYVAPMLRRLRAHVPPRLAVVADGARLDDGGRGFVVVANSRQYAMRMNPAMDATMDDGLLDVVWFPSSGLADLFGWMLRCEFGHQFDDGRARSVRAAAVSISADEPFLYQLDGDPPWARAVGEPTRSLEIVIEPSRLDVLRGA
ncbi:MAG TPA: diacylglycerol kinase family protein [Phycisphaerales bacterium]|nr:diacylglycerol kinase family protein [Phycisphaerales bacterium]